MHGHMVTRTFKRLQGGKEERSKEVDAFAWIGCAVFWSCGSEGARECEECEMSRSARMQIHPVVQCPRSTTLRPLKKYQ